MLEVVATWSKWRLFWTIVLSYAALAEILSLTPTNTSTCIVEHINNVCPSLHVFLFRDIDIFFDRVRRGDAVFIILVVLAIVAIWESAARLCAEGESENQNQRYDDGGLTKGPITRFLDLDKTTQFTAILAVVGVLQWQTLEKTDQTLKLQSRAWIAPRGLVAAENFKSTIDKYTEVTLRLENVGKEPAINTAEVVATEALPVDDFRNEEVLKVLIQKMLEGRTCDSIPIDPNGRAIFPGGMPAIIVGFEEEKVTKINKRTHYALVVGCFVYETMNETHRTRFCGILEPPAASKDWRSDTCPIHNDAQ